MVGLTYPASQQSKELVDTDTLKEKQASTRSANSKRRQPLLSGHAILLFFPSLIPTFMVPPAAANSNISFYMILRE